MKSKIKWSAIWANLPKFTGLPLKYKNGKYYGKCYIDGAEHPRWNKTVAAFKNDKIILMEQGGFNDDLISWMQTYGRYSDDRSIFKALEKESGNKLHIPEHKPPKRIYVYDKLMKQTLGLYSDNLYNFLCTLFHERKVQIVFDMYHVGSSGEDVVFWFQDENMNICHDKRMTYKTDGHRDKTKFPYRFFHKNKGFTGLTYFGMHLVNNYKDDIYLVESEKTALLFYLMYGKLCLATGGSNCILPTERNFILLPDYDKAGEKWIEQGGIKWWEQYTGIQKGDDIGDAIVRKRLLDLHM